MKRHLFFVLVVLGLISAVGAFYAGTRSQHKHLSAIVQPSHQEVDHHSEVITGQVLSAEGQPVSGVMVMAFNTAFTPTGQPPMAFTDEQGKFRIEGLAPGTYKLYTQKEEDGYPFSMHAFPNVNPQSIPQVTVVEGQPTQDITVNLGPKAAKLKVAVVDAATNKPVKDAQVILRRTDNPNWRHVVGGPDAPKLTEQAEILVPPVPFTVEVSAPGYKDWNSKDSSSSKQPYELHLAADSTKKLVISLSPDK